MNTPAPRTRVRSTTAQARPEATPEMRDKAAQHFLANIEANKQKGVADKARKSLYQLMKDGGVTSFGHSIPTADGSVHVDVKVETPEGTAIDIRALLSLMKVIKDPKAFEKAVDKESWEQFLDMAGVSKKSIQDQLGNAAATRCETPAVGTENVSVKAKKD